MRPSISARLSPTFSGVSGALTHSPGASAVCTSMPVEMTEPVAAWEVENIRHGLNGHQWSSPTSDPAQKRAVSARTTTARHDFAAAPSRTTPGSTPTG